MKPRQPSCGHVVAPQMTSAWMRLEENLGVARTQLPNVPRQPGPHHSQRPPAASYRPACQPRVIVICASKSTPLTTAPAGAVNCIAAAEKPGARTVALPTLRASSPAPANGSAGSTVPPGQAAYAVAYGTLGTHGAHELFSDPQQEVTS